MDGIKEMLDRLSDLDEGQLSDLESKIICEFETVEKQEPTAQVVDSMTALADALDAVRGEQQQGRRPKDLETARRRGRFPRQARQEEEGRRRGGRPPRVRLPSRTRPAEAPPTEVPPRPRPRLRRGHRRRGGSCRRRPRRRRRSGWPPRARSRPRTPRQPDQPGQPQPRATASPTTRPRTSRRTRRTSRRLRTTSPRPQQHAGGPENTPRARWSSPLPPPRPPKRPPPIRLPRTRRSQWQPPHPTWSSRRPPRTGLFRVRHASVAITAGADIPGYSAGTELSSARQVTDAFMKRLHNLSARLVTERPAVHGRDAHRQLPRGPRPRGRRRRGQLGEDPERRRCRGHHRGSGCLHPAGDPLRHRRHRLDRHPGPGLAARASPRTAAASGSTRARCSPTRSTTRATGVWDPLGPTATNVSRSTTCDGGRPRRWSADQALLPGAVPAVRGRRARSRDDVSLLRQPHRPGLPRADPCAQRAGPGPARPCHRAVLPVEDQGAVDARASPPPARWSGAADLLDPGRQGRRGDPVPQPHLADAVVPGDHPVLDPRHDPVRHRLPDAG